MPRVIKVKTNRFGAGRQLDTVIVEAISFFFFRPRFQNYEDIKIKVIIICNALLRS